MCKFIIIWGLCNLLFSGESPAGAHLWIKINFFQIISKAVIGQLGFCFWINPSLIKLTDRVFKCFTKWILLFLSSEIFLPVNPYLISRFPPKLKISNSYQSLDHDKVCQNFPFLWFHLVQCPEETMAGAGDTKVWLPAHSPLISSISFNMILFGSSDKAQAGLIGRD